MYLNLKIDAHKNDTFNSSSPLDAINMHVLLF